MAQALSAVPSQGIVYSSWGGGWVVSSCGFFPLLSPDLVYTEPSYFV